MRSVGDADECAEIIKEIMGKLSENSKLLLCKFLIVILEEENIPVTGMEPKEIIGHMAYELSDRSRQIFARIMVGMAREEGINVPEKYPG